MGMNMSWDTDPATLINAERGRKIEDPYNRIAVSPPLVHFGELSFLGSEHFSHSLSFSLQSRPPLRSQGIGLSGLRIPIIAWQTSRAATRECPWARS